MIKGKRIALRAVESSDIETIWKWENDSDVMGFASSSPARCISLEAVRKSFERSGFPSRDGSFRYIIENEERKAIGLALYSTPKAKFPRSVELGIYIGEKDQWGKGYGSDALMTLLDVLFRHVGVHRVTIATSARNDRMLAMLRRLGVKEEGRVREERFLDGSYCDTVLMGVLEAEFQALKRNWMDRDQRVQRVRSVAA